MTGSPDPHASPSNRPLSRQAFARILAAIVVAALILRLPGYGQSVWLDELFTSDIFCGEPVILLKTLYSDIHPPAYFVFMHVWNGLFGDSEVVLRLPPLLSGLASIVLIAALGDVFVGRRTGLVAAFLLAVSPVHIWYSREGRPYSTNLMLLLLAVLAFHRLLAGRRSGGWTAVYFCSLAGAVFTHYYMATFLFVFAGLAVLHGPTCRKRVLWCNGAILALLGLYMAAKSYFSHVPVTGSYLRSFGLGETWSLHFNWFLTGNTLTPMGGETGIGTTALVVLQILGAALFARGVARLWPAGGASKAGRDLLVYMLAIPAFLFGLSLIGLNKTYIERSALPALPFFLLIMATGMTGWQRPVAARVCAGVTTASCALVLIAFFAQPDSWTVYKPKPDWRAAASCLATEIADNDGVEVVYSDYISPTALTYYDPRLREAKHFEQNERKLDKLLSTTARVFGTEGFPGAGIQSVIHDQLAALDRTMAQARAQTRVAIHDLARRDPFAAEAVTPESFWLLIHDKPTQRARRVLRDDRLQIVDERRFRSLILYKLSRVD